MAQTEIQYPNFENHTILVAEDDEISFLLLSEILLDTKIKIFRAENGIKALKLVKDHPEAKIMLMDIKMPGIDGLEAVKEIKKINPSLYIIAQTAFASSFDRIKCLNAGCNNYMSKPIDESVLLEIINAQLSK